MEAKPKRQLDVFWGRRLVGQYNLLSDETECFSYDSDYLASSDAVPISHSLPLRSDAYGRRQLRPFFAGLLPEESQRERMCSTYLLTSWECFRNMWAEKINHHG